MNKYIVTCYTSTATTLVVEADSADAVAAVGTQALGAAGEYPDVPPTFESCDIELAEDQGITARARVAGGTLTPIPPNPRHRYVVIYHHRHGSDVALSVRGEPADDVIDAFISEFWASEALAAIDDDPDAYNYEFLDAYEGDAREDYLSFSDEDRAFIRAHWSEILDDEWFDVRDVEVD